MKKLISTLLLSACLSLTVFAGDIPGTNPGGGGCGSCRKTNIVSGYEPSTLETITTEFVTGLLALVF